jgi:hypothetical protein
MKSFFSKIQNVSRFVLFAIIIFFIGGFVFYRVMDTELVKCKTKLARHGQLDRLTDAECRFVKKQKQSNSSFFQNDIVHLRDLDSKFKKLIFRHKELEKTMTYEWAAVREQTMLLEQASLNNEEQFVVFEICEQLSKCITDICELMDKQQSVLLYWENVKNERIKQKEEILKKLKNITVVDNYVPDSSDLAQDNNNTEKTNKNL